LPGRGSRCSPRTRNRRPRNSSRAT
jgi:hypothetical protein